MKVKELIKELNLIKNKDREVLLSSDAEGNSYSSVCEIDECAARKEGQSYEVGLEELTLGHSDCGYTEDDVIDDGIPVLVIWP